MTIKNVSKRIIALVLVFVFVTTTFAGCKKSENTKANAVDSESRIEKSTTEPVESESVFVTDDNGEPVTDESGSTVTETKIQFESTTKKNSSTGGAKPNSTAQNSVKPTKPASTPANKPTTTTQLAVNACSHNWKLISYTNGCYVYHCAKCDDYKTEERECNPEDFVVCMGNKSEYMKLLGYINEARRKAGLRELVYLDEFQKGADIRARELVKNYSHTRPNGKNATSVFDEYRYTTMHGHKVITLGECIAGGDTAEFAFGSWMNSPGHKKAIMLSCNFGFVASWCAGNWTITLVADPSLA